MFIFISPNFQILTSLTIQYALKKAKSKNMLLKLQNH